MSKELQSLIIKINKSHWKTEEERNEINHCIDVIKEREEKALAFDLINQYNVDVARLKNSKNVEEYNEQLWCMPDVAYLEEEDFMFLKKVFKYE